MIQEPKSAYFIQMPFVSRNRPVALDAVSKLAAKAAHLWRTVSRLTTYTPLSEQIFDICGAERKTRVGPDGILDCVTRKTKPFLAWNGSGQLHVRRRPAQARANKLAVLRKSMDGFAACVANNFNLEPYSGAI